MCMINELFLTIIQAREMYENGMSVNFADVCMNGVSECAGENVCMIIHFYLFFACLMVSQTNQA